MLKPRLRFLLCAVAGTVLPLALLPATATAAATPKKVVFSADGDHDFALPPSTVKTLHIVVIGGGGGGGGGGNGWPSSQGAGGGSGAGGTTVTCDISNGAGDSSFRLTKLSVHIGSGGAPGAGGDRGHEGGYSSLGIPGLAGPASSIVLAKGGGGGGDATKADPGTGGRSVSGSKCRLEKNLHIHDYPGDTGGRPIGTYVGSGGGETNAQAPIKDCWGQGNGGKGGDGGDREGGHAGAHGHGGCVIITY
ncbi:hypothetical protein [Streptomyces sp. NPDC051364]|uniref:glycine-rich domain-containing protein n=1 Tax=Streptomyces sp. NPDC051364 TaxID=3155799 RepID=UPI003434295F